MSEQISRDDRYTYADYKNWPDTPRYELIDGMPYMMSSPRFIHQRLVTALSAFMETFFKGKECVPISSPFDVRFEEDEEKADTVVQPDFLVVCDREKIHDEGIIGAPDLVVEIISPSSASYDTLKKRNLYERNAVREYWIISPDEKDITQLVLRDGRFELMNYENGLLKSHALPGLELDAAALFAAVE